jgi:hypothetical protein
LRGRVEELLQAHRDAGAFLGGADPQNATRDEPIAGRPGTVLGPYKLEQEIGAGGMGPSGWPNKPSRSSGWWR